jgi:hypothetical protein
MLLERFLEERGINTQMALFIPEYIDLKEQKEYIGWLNSKWTAAHVSAIYTNENLRHEELCLLKRTREKRCRLGREVNLYITGKGRDLCEDGVSMPQGARNINETNNSTQN